MKRFMLLTVSAMLVMVGCNSGDDGDSSGGYERSYLKLADIKDAQALYLIDNGAKTRAASDDFDSGSLYKLKANTPSSMNKFSYSKNKPEDTLSKVEAIVDKIESKGIDITGDHGQWLRLGFALAREFGEGGRDLFDRISRQSPLYDKTIITDEQFTRCLNSQSSGAEVTIGTFFHIAKEEGVY